LLIDKPRNVRRRRRWRTKGAKIATDGDASLKPLDEVSYVGPRDLPKGAL